MAPSEELAAMKEPKKSTVTVSPHYDRPVREAFLSKQGLYPAHHRCNRQLRGVFVVPAGPKLS